MGLLQSDGFLKDNSNAAQRLLDGVNLVAQSVSELSVKPAKAVTSWLTDQIAPAYWKPNSLISVSDTRRPAPPRLPPTHPPPISQVNASLPTDVFTGSLRAVLTQSCVCGSQDKTRHGSWLAGQFCLMMSVAVLSLASKVCHKCHTVFQDNDTKHHCRACGEGFCDGCSSQSAPVPERGWGLGPVRVCDVCFEQRAAYAGTHV